MVPVSAGALSGAQGAEQRRHVGKLSAVGIGGSNGAEPRCDLQKDS